MRPRPERVRPRPKKIFEAEATMHKARPLEIKIII